MTRRAVFKLFKTGPEIIRPAEMLCVRVLLSRRNADRAAGETCCKADAGLPALIHVVVAGCALPKIGFDVGARVVGGRDG